MKMAASEMEFQKKRLIYFSEKYADANQAAIKNKKVIADFDIANPLGQQVYRGFSNEELIDLVKQRAEALGHSPAQGEMFCVLRGYIKARFRKWPYVLELAGLPKSAGPGGIKIG